MFDIGWSEFVVIGVVALIVIGPKELPAVLRTVGQWTTKIRRMAAEFQSQFQEAMREAEMADLKKEVDDLANTAKGFTSDFDSLNLKDATKWEPKPEGAAAPDAAGAVPAATVGDAAGDTRSSISSEADLTDAAGAVPAAAVAPAKADLPAPEAPAPQSSAPASSPACAPDGAPADATPVAAGTRPA